MKLGGVEVIDFDIGVGWQTKGNYGGWEMWLFSVVCNQLPGELTPNMFGTFMITILGFYFRIHVFGPHGDINSRRETE